MYFLHIFGSYFKKLIFSAVSESLQMFSVDCADEIVNDIIAAFFAIKFQIDTVSVLGVQRETEHFFGICFFGRFTGKVGVQHYPGQIGQQAGVRLAVYGGQPSETQVPERTVSPVLPDRFKINEVGGNQPDLETVVKLDIGGFGSAAELSAYLPRAGLSS